MNSGDELQERCPGQSTTEQNMGPVLIVEDDPDIAESLRYGLESAEFETRVAHTGEEGLSESLNSNHPPVLILLDLLLPGMSGAEICRRLRLEPSTQRTPIIMISARASASDIAVGLSAGADEYIGKPFSIKDVISRIHALLRSRQRDFEDTEAKCVDVDRNNLIGCARKQGVFKFLNGD